MSAPSLTPRGVPVFCDAALPFLERISDPARLLELLTTRVLPVVGPGHDVAAVRFDDVTYTPGHRCLVLCSLIPRDGSAVPIQRALVTMATGDRLAAVHAHALSAPGSVLVPEINALVELFPADYSMPTLAEAASAEQMLPVIERITDAPGLRVPFDVQILHYRPHRRCVLAYQPIGGRDDGPAMVGKVYRPGSESRAAWSALAFAHSKLTPLGIGVPRPFPLVEHLNLLLMERLSGSMVKSQLHDDAPPTDKLETVLSAAGLLATLHLLPADGSSVRTIDSELRTLNKRAEPLTIVAPALARRVQGLIAQVASRSARTTGATPCFIHGDFTPSQLLITRDEMAVLDFDLAGPGDPAIDVANFTTKLRRRARRSGDDEFRWLAAAFLDEYQRHAGTDPTMVHRVRVLESLTLVRTAIRAFRHGPFSSADGTAPLLPQLFLDEAELSLTES